MMATSPEYRYLELREYEPDRSFICSDLNEVELNTIMQSISQRHENKFRGKVINAINCLAKLGYRVISTHLKGEAMIYLLEKSIKHS